jgi:uncharacterized protein (TIGR02996 family)
MDDADFLRAIAEDRDDDALRLVYADWLDERADPRGEYLRLQQQVVRATARMEELRRQLDPAWTDAVRLTPRRCDVQLATGRTIRLLSLRQWAVYAGLLEGLPTRDLNQRLIDGTLAEERNRPHAAEPYLIRPAERPLKYHSDRPYPFGEPVALPGVGCVGEFESLQPAKGTGDCSALTVVWYQDEFGPPSEPALLDQFRAIDWNRHASDYQW